MRSALLFALVAPAITACEKTDPLYCQMNPEKCGMGSGIDATDSPPLIDAQQCFGSNGFEVCLTDLPQAPLTFPGAGTFDTTDGASVSPACLATQPEGWKLAGNRDACFLIGKSIEINGKLDVIGDRPLVLVATTTILVGADLDVASHINGKTGPGAPDPACPGFSVMPENDTAAGAGGGAGGSYMHQGGTGGSGNNGMSTAGAPTAAESSVGVLRAGCDGQNGGQGQGNLFGIGGHGGGAVYLVAGTGITVTSGVRINASGAGAKAGAGRYTGGGGGGAGGTIILSAPTITATSAVLIANGGGGSSGGEDSNSGNAVDGQDPMDPTVRAPGGTVDGVLGPDMAGAGGKGWIDGDGAGGVGANGATNRGGGGGGGGGGYIQTSVSSGATASPTPVIK